MIILKWHSYVRAELNSRSACFCLFTAPPWQPVSIILGGISYLMGGRGSAFFCSPTRKELVWKKWGDFKYILLHLALFSYIWIIKTNTCILIRVFFRMLNIHLDTVSLGCSKCSRVQKTVLKFLDVHFAYISFPLLASIKHALWYSKKRKNAFKACILKKGKYHYFVCELNL